MMNGESLRRNVRELSLKASVSSAVISSFFVSFLIFAELSNIKISLLAAVPVAFIVGISFMFFLKTHQN